MCHVRNSVSMMLCHGFSINLIAISTLFRQLIRKIRYPIFTKLADWVLTLYFRLYCDLSPSTVDLDELTTMHIWTPAHRRIDRLNHVMIHGFGCNAKWQFVWQVSQLSRTFNLFVPDLVFFGNSRTRETERTDCFQAKCLVEGLRRLGLSRFTIYSISYGGFVAQRVAEMYPSAVERLVIVSSGVGWCKEEKAELLNKFDVVVSEVLVPNNPRDLRLLVRLSSEKDRTALDWAPDWLLKQFIRAMYDECRKELKELVSNLLEREEDDKPPAITQETLIVWGDKDRVFPVEYARRLQRQLPNSRLAIVEGAGHAVNMQAPNALNNLIISFAGRRF